jgi:hypothetical protein
MIEMEPWLPKFLSSYACEILAIQIQTPCPPQQIHGIKVQMFLGVPKSYHNVI